MRGKLNSELVRRDSLGLIPAHAGKTSAISNSRYPKAAHPRACGENAVRAASALNVAGSSPRMRGKRHTLPIRECLVRLIPAHAGKTPRRAFHTTAAPAHPRACGENFLGHIEPSTVPGSSPRMRGKLRPDAAMAARRRLIPAHAGKTIRWMRAMWKKRAHPRACGENNGLGADKKREYGSSPRMRGKRTPDR